MAMYSHIPTLSSRQLRDHWRDHQPERPDTDDGYLDEIAIEIRRRGPDGSGFLQSQLHHADELRVSAAILGLSFPPVPDPNAPTVLLNLLEDARPRVRASAVRGLSAYGQSAALPRIAAMVDDLSPLVRCAALEFVRQHDAEHSRSILLAALVDGDDIVRMCAADELDELGDPSVVPRLRSLLDDPHPDVRQAVETAIETLAGSVPVAARAGSAD